MQSGRSGDRTPSKNASSASWLCRGNGLYPIFELHISPRVVFAWLRASERRPRNNLWSRRTCVWLSRTYYVQLAQFHRGIPRLFGFSRSREREEDGQRERGERRSQKIGGCALYLSPRFQRFRYAGVFAVQVSR